MCLIITLFAEGIVTLHNVIDLLKTVIKNQTTSIKDAIYNLLSGF